MSEYEELKQLATDAYKAGKYDIATKAMDKMEAIQQSQQTQPEQYDLPPMDDISSLPTQRPALSFKDRVVQRADQIRRDTMGGIEGMASMMTAMPATTIGQFSGGIQGIARQKHPLAGPESRDRVTSALTYQPKTPEGQQFVQGSAEAAENIIGPYVDAARLGDEALEAGYSEGVARNAEAIPEYLGAVLAPLGMRNPQKPIIQKDKYGNVVSGLKPKEVAKIDLLNNPKNATTAKYKLSESGAVMKDPVAKAGLKQGWDDQTVSGVRAGTAETKTAIRNMLDIEAKRLKGDAEFAQKNRPADVMGANMFKRYNAIEGIANKSGKKIAKIAKDQGAAPIDISGPLDWFYKKLKEKGAVIKDGEIDLSRSQFPESDHGLLRENFKQINLALDDNLNFKNAHDLKRRLREVGINYEPTLANAGATPATQKLFKDLTKGINTILTRKVPAYAASNKKYSSAIDIVNKLKKLERSLQEGGYLDNSPVSDNMGTKMRRLTGNPTSRGALKSIIENMETVLKENQKTFNDDLFTQLAVANDIDRVIAPVADTSLLGDVAKNAATTGSGTASVAVQAFETGNKILGAKSPEKAIATLRALTR